MSEYMSLTEAVTLAWVIQSETRRPFRVDEIRLNQFPLEIGSQLVFKPSSPPTYSIRLTILDCDAHHWIYNQAGWRWILRNLSYVNTPEETAEFVRRYDETHHPESAL